MKILTNTFGLLILPMKIILEVIDPILRFFETMINIVLHYILGGIVEIFNKMPNIGFVSLGELILSILSSIFVFLFWDNIPFISEIPLTYKILICLGLLILGYFILYFVINVLIDLMTSIIAFFVVLFRVSLYLPGSILLSIVRIICVIITGIVLKMIYPDNFFVLGNEITFLNGALLTLGINIIVSVILLGVRNDIKVHKLGLLANLNLADLKAFNKSIGLYVMTLGVVPYYIGRAIEFRNGGFRKRISDYTRESNTGRKHTSGKIINSLQKELYVHIIEMGHLEEDVALVKKNETTMIGKIYTALNDKDSKVSYPIHITGYVLGLIISIFLVRTFVNSDSIKNLLYVFSVINFIVCGVLYFIQNSND